MYGINPVDTVLVVNEVYIAVEESKDVRKEKERKKFTEEQRGEEEGKLSRMYLRVTGMCAIIAAVTDQ